MGLFGRDKSAPVPGMGKQSISDLTNMAKQMQEQAMAQAAAFQQASAPPPASADGTTAPAAEVGSMTWARRVMAILAPTEPGFVKRCNCAVCGAPKKLPTTNAYVYCDYCASLCDFDLRRACEGDTAPGPEYAAIVNGAHASMQAAVAAGDRDAYRALQKQVFEAFVANVPNAMSHRARNDAAYREAYVNYMAEGATVRAFDPAAQALEAEMKQRVMSLRYGGNMMAPTVEADSFWPMAETLEKQLALFATLYRSTGVVELDPDHAEHLTTKMGWSGFCQGWLAMLPEDAAAQLLQRAGLTNDYVAIEVETGQPRHCGGCGGEFHALPDAKAVVCDGCGRTVDLGSAEIPCGGCGATMTLPRGADHIACPFCQTDVEQVGIR